MVNFAKSRQNYVFKHKFSVKHAISFIGCWSGFSKIFSKNFTIYGVAEIRQRNVPFSGNFFKQTFDGICCKPNMEAEVQSGAAAKFLTGKKMLSKRPIRIHAKGGGFLLP